ncbi:MAG: hypothetical protein K5768_03530 [Firmicutes bacterium]|nr:hypothetical protein [Bacillota bacterium]
MRKPKGSDRTEREEYLYHNTLLLLKKYRDVVWSIEVAAMQAQMDFEAEMDCKLDDFLNKSYQAGADLAGTEIQEQMRVMERNKKMLKMIDAAVDLLRRKQVDGEIYYQILYLTYLSDKPLKTTEEIVEKLAQNGEYMSWKTYFNKRTKAIEILSTVLWGFTSKECMPIIEDFLGGKK